MNQAKSEAFGLKTTCNYTFGAHVYINDSIHVYTHSFRFRVRTSSLKHPKNAGLNSQGLHSQWLVFKLHLCMNISSNLKGRASAGHTSLGVVNAGVPTTLTSLENQNWQV